MRPVADYLKMKMWAGGIAGVAALRDGLALLDILPRALAYAR